MTYYAKYKDKSLRDFVDRVFDTKPELNEVLKIVQKNTSVTISKEDLLMYLGYVFVRYGDESAREETTVDTIYTLIKYCSYALEGENIKFCSNMKQIFREKDIIDLYDDMTEEQKIAMKVAKQANKSVQNNPQERASSSTNERY